MRNSKLIVSAAVAISAISGIRAASAADLPARTYTKAPAVVVDPSVSWTGFYIGGNLGGAWGRSDYDFLASGAWTAANVAALASTGAARLSMNNVSGGAQAGYNWQMNSLVLGFEADIQYMGLRKTNSFTQTAPLATLTVPFTFTESSRSNWLATVRGRIGFTANNVLFYGTGGLAIADSQSSDLANFTGASVASAASRSDTQFGWTAGAGLEWAFSPNWSVKGEYLYAQFGRTTTVMPAIDGILLQSYSDRLSVNIARVGVNYRFGGPVVARY